MMRRYTHIECPFCGERQPLTIDCSSEVQYYHKECWTCCRAMAVNITCSYEGELLSVEVESEPVIPEM